MALKTGLNITKSEALIPFPSPNRLFDKTLGNPSTYPSINFMYCCVVVTAKKITKKMDTGLLGLISVI